MFNKKNILKDLPSLVEQGLIDKEAGEKLRDFYLKKNKEDEKLSPLSIVKSLSLYLIGAIFSIIGGYMFIDYNWSFFSDFFKAILMFAPLVASVPMVFYALKKSSILFDCIALALNFIGLILALLAPSVIYNASGSQLDFFTALVFLSCPLIIFLKQPLGLVLGAVLMIVLKCSIVDYSPSDTFNLSSFTYLFFFAIFLYQALNVKERISYKAASKLFATFLLTISFIIARFDAMSENLFIISFVLCAFALYKGREILLLLALTIFTWLTCGFSVFSNISRRAGIDSLWTGDFYLNALTIALLTFGLISIGLSIYKKRGLINISIASLLFIHFLVFMILPSFNTKLGYDLVFATKILCNVSVLALFVLLFARGIKERSLIFLNEAFAVIIAYALFKLDDNYWTLAGRSALFFGIGIAMIVSNKILNRKIKQNEAK